MVTCFDNFHFSIFCSCSSSAQERSKWFINKSSVNNIHVSMSTIPAHIYIWNIKSSNIYLTKHEQFSSSPALISNIKLFLVWRHWQRFVYAYHRERHFCHQATKESGAKRPESTQNLFQGFSITMYAYFACFRVECRFCRIKTAQIWSYEVYSVVIKFR